MLRLTSSIVALALLTVSACHRSSVSSEKDRTAVYQVTYLKAKNDQRLALSKFIRRHWYAMDAEGVKRGIFTHYALVEPTTDKKAWDFAMVVGYPQAAGYDDARTQKTFTSIRKGHLEQHPEAADLDALGTIVGEDRFRVSQ